MALDKIYLLPQTILIDVDELIKHDFVKVKDVYNLIKQRYKQKIKFTKNELEEYIGIRRQELNAKDIDAAGIILLPAKVSEDSNATLDATQDKSLAVNVRNKAAVLEFFKEKIMNRIVLIENQQAKTGRIDPYMEALVISYTKEMHSIIEKEIKLQLEIEESSKLDKIVQERISMLFLILKAVIEKHVTPEISKAIQEDMEETFEVYKMGDENANEKK